MSYYQFQSETGESYGSFQVFQVLPYESVEEELAAGFYWWACFPGCLPDGEPCGPFFTEAEAIADAQDFE